MLQRPQETHAARVPLLPCSRRQSATRLGGSCPGRVRHEHRDQVQQLDSRQEALCPESCPHQDEGLGPRETPIQSFPASFVPQQTCFSLTFLFSLGSSFFLDRLPPAERIQKITGQAGVSSSRGETRGKSPGPVSPNFPLIFHFFQKFLHLKISGCDVPGSSHSKFWQTPMSYFSLGCKKLE